MEANTEGLSASAQRVQNALDKLGVQVKVVELPASTRTAEEAAAAVNCQVGQIVKSLIFRAKTSGQAVLVLASGPNRVDVARVGQALGEPIERADADFVREQTGFAIGGIPPVGHNQALVTFMDEDLLQYQLVWAAAGTPHAVFPIHPQTLAQISSARVLAVRQEKA